MAEALSRRGHEIHVVTYHHGDEVGPLPYQVHRIREVRTYRKRSPGPSYQKLLVVDPLLAFKLLEVLKSHAIDLVHAHHYEGLLVSLLARRQFPRPLVYDAHTLLETELPFYGLGLPKRGKRWIGGRLDRSLPQRATHIIAASEEIKISLGRDGDLGKRISVIPNGVEWKHFEVEADPEQDRGRKGRILVYAGGLSEYQGIDLLLRSLVEVLKQRRDVRLLIVTNASFEPYEALAAKLGVRDRVDIATSDFDRLPGHLAAADLALNPRTDCGGYPMKLLNYMAAGKPIVSFKGSARDLAHGELGWVVEDGDVTAFARAVIMLLDDPGLARRLGAQARKFVRAGFSWERTAERTEAVYRHLLDPPREAHEHGGP